MRPALTLTPCLIALACSAQDGAPADATDGGLSDSALTDVVWPDSADATPSLRDDGMTPPWRWDEMAARVMDSTSLQSGFSAAGYTPPAGTGIYAARVADGPLGFGYTFFDNGGGAFSQSFWPASTVKLLTSLAALDWVQSQGFTGAASVKWESGYSDVLNNIVERAIQVSSNEDYDRTIRIAGFDQLNAQWLAPARGFPSTVIKASYAGFEVKNPPGYTLSEGGKSQVVPARAATGNYPCKSGGNNCTNLFELTEAVRRVVWHTAITEEERFALPSTDRAVLVNALCTATPSFFETGVEAALGGGARICHKPGWVPGSDSLDHGVIEAADGRKFLLAASVPDPGDSSSQGKLAKIAEHTLSVINAAPSDGFVLQHDAGVKMAIEVSPSELRIFGAGGTDTMQLFYDGQEIPLSVGPDRVFSTSALPTQYAGKLVTLRGYAAGVLVGVRNVVLPAGG